MKWLVLFFRLLLNIFTSLLGSIHLRGFAGSLTNTQKDLTSTLPAEVWVFVITICKSGRQSVYQLSRLNLNSIWFVTRFWCRQAKPRYLKFTLKYAAVVISSVHKLSFFAFLLVYEWVLNSGTRRSAVGWDAALQVGRSRIGFPMMQLEFFIDTLALGSTQPLTEMSARNTSWG